MNFFDNLVLPQSAEHIELLNYLLIVLFGLFLPYIGVLFVSGLLSIIYRGKARRESSPIYLNFAQDLIRMPTLNKSVGVVLGILPFLTITFIVSQILHKTTSFILDFMFTAFFLGSIGVILIYTYRYSQDFEGLYSRIKRKINDQDFDEEIEQSSKGSSRLAARSGLWGVLSLGAALWFLLSALTMIMNPSLLKADSIFVLFSWKMLLLALQFLAISAALTGAALLFVHYYWEDAKNFEDPGYDNFIRKIGLHLTFWGALAVPFAMLLLLISIDHVFLTGTIFTFSVLALILLFIAYNIIYAIVKTGNLKLSGPVFFLILFTAFSLIVKDQSAMSSATAQNRVILDAEFQTYLTGLTGGRSIEEVSGKEIYDVRCSSCHKFEVKLVGPAYNDVLPKYEGKKDQLAGFVLNPVKVNPAFPPMPNPGLKPNEAQAVAEYLLKTYQKK